MKTEDQQEAPLAPASTETIEETIELAKRAYALKKYEQAVQHYATALEKLTEKHGDDAPEIADMYFAYGKALLENAISQNSVLGKDEPEDDGGDPEGASGSGAFLSFSGDGDEDQPVDLFADQPKEEAEEEAENEDEEEGEPEDDFNAAWEVLDLARAIFEKQQDEDDQMKLKLAETYITLGDVSLETEKFDQAITDYTAGLKLKVELLPQSSRQIAEAHYKLSIVLDLSSGKLASAIEHAEKALESVEARLAELRNGISGQMKVESLPDSSASDPKGKGKATAKGPRILGDDAIHKLSKSQMEAEVKELEGLKEDLALKVEELKTIPNESNESAPVLAAKALDAELKVPSSSSGSAAPLPVNDLTSMVKRKKKAPEANGSTKRKAEDDAEAPSEKKARVDDVPEP